MLDKKAQLEDLLPLLLLMFLLVFVVMFVLFNNQIKESKLKEELEFESIRMDSSQLLISFLRSPFAFSNHEISNVADAMNYYFLTEDEDLFNKIDAKANEFFSKSDLETGDYSWSLIIDFSGKRPLTVESDRAEDRATRIVISELIVPKYDPSEFMEIKLFRVRIP